MAKGKGKEQAIGKEKGEEGKEKETSDSEEEDKKEKEDSGLGFANNEGSQLNVKVSNAEIDKIVKKYKKIQKYRKSSLFAVQSMDETEDMINKMVDEIMKDDSE